MRCKTDETFVVVETLICPLQILQFLFCYAIQIHFTIKHNYFFHCNAIKMYVLVVLPYNLLNHLDANFRVTSTKFASAS